MKRNERGGGEATTRRVARFLLILAGLGLSSSCATYNPQRQFQRELEEMPAGGVLIPGVADLDPARRQDGLAAIEPLISFWGGAPITAAEQESARQQIADGVPVEEIMESLLDARGLWSFAFYGTMDELEARIETGLPLLVIVQDDPNRPVQRRYLLVTGFNREAEKIIGMEGGPYPGIYPYKRFRALWRPVRNWVMVVCPPERVKWELRTLEHVAFARYRERRGEWDEAIQAFDAASSLEPDNTGLMLARADALYRSGDEWGALALYRSVLRLDEFNPRAANNLAFVLADTDADLGEAERLVRRALTIEPSNPVYLDTLGLILMKAGRPREAADALARARQRGDFLPRDDQRSIVTHLLQAYLDSNQPHLARQVLLDHRATDPDFDPGARILGQIPP